MPLTIIYVDTPTEALARFNQMYFISPLFFLFAFISLIFLIKVILSKQKFKINFIIILVCTIGFCVFNGIVNITYVIALSLYASPNKAVNFPWAVSMFIFLMNAFYLVKFFYLLYFWFGLVMAQEPSYHSSKAYRYRKLILSLCCSWLVGWSFVSGVSAAVGHFELYSATIAIEIVNRGAIAIMIAIVAIRLRKLITKVKNNERGNNFSRRFTIVAIIFVICLVMVIGHDAAYFVYITWQNIPLPFFWIFRGIPDYTTVAAVLWFMNPFRISRITENNATEKYTPTTLSEPKTSTGATGSGNSHNSVSVSVSNPDSIEMSQAVTFSTSTDDYASRNSGDIEVDIALEEPEERVESHESQELPQETVV